MLTYKFPLHQNVNMCVFTIGILTSISKAYKVQKGK